MNEWSISSRSQSFSATDSQRSHGNGLVPASPATPTAPRQCDSIFSDLRKSTAPSIACSQTHRVVWHPRYWTGTFTSTNVINTKAISSRVLDYCCHYGSRDATNSSCGGPSSNARSVVVDHSETISPSEIVYNAIV